jgi:predicted acyltransferase (DUF342 family)
MIRQLLTASLLASALALTATPAHAKQDAVQFGSDIHIPEGGTVHDAVCFFCSVRDEGTVDGDIVVFFGNVYIAGSAHHDVVNFFGSVRAEDNASIGHDMVNFFGSVHLGENVSVGKDLVVMFGWLRAADSVSVGGDRVAPAPWVFWGPMFFVILIFIAIVREFRSWRRRQFLAAYGIPPMPPPPAPPIL